jgi:outer membrane lipoprotein-sorting protein
MTKGQDIRAILTCWAAAMLLAPVASAQDAAEILHRTAETYRQIKTWDIEQTVVEATAGASASRTEQRERYAAVEGKNRWERGPLLTIADGKYEWTYSSRTNRYTQHEQGPLCSGLLPIGYWIPDSEKVKHLALLREENVTVGGVAVPSYVVEIARDSSEPPETLWIDKSRYLVLKRERRTSPAITTQRISTTALTKVSINQPVADSVFTFVPPPGATVEAPKSAAAPSPAPATVKKKKKK